jgi:hypothetical protein
VTCPESYPCCEHCWYPGCPEWNRHHEVRCWQCLRGLCLTHGELGRQPPELVSDLREYLITVDHMAEVSADMALEVIKSE